MSRVLLIVLSMTGVLLSGCEVLGPRAIRSGRMNYNEAVQQTTKEQLLLNLVRLKNDEPPLFFDVTGVVSQPQLQLGAATGDISLPPHKNNAAGYPVNGSIQYTDAPAITYAPLQGKDYVAQMLSPVGVDSIVSLYNSGWQIDRILYLVAYSINGYSSEHLESSPGSGSDAKSFANLVDQLRQLQNAHVLQLSVEPVERTKPGAKAMMELKEAEKGEGKDEDKKPDETQFRLVLEVNTSALKDPALTPVFNRLKSYQIDFSEPATQPADKAAASQEASPQESQAESTVKIYGLTPGVAKPERAPPPKTPTTAPTPRRWFDIRLRTPLGSLMYAGRYAGDAHVRLPHDQNAATWETLFNLRCGKYAPRKSYVSVEYDGKPYWINDDASKRTFALLSQLILMQAGPIQNRGVLLTLPVNPTR